MSFVAPALPYISAIGSALGAYGGYQAAQYQSAVAAANAQAAQNNAARERYAADQDMLDKDSDARRTIGELVAQMSASGLAAGQGTMLLRRTGLQALADRDRERLAQKRDINFENRMQEAAAFKAQAKAASSSARMSLIGGLLSVPASYLSGSSMLNDYRRSQYALTRPSIQG